MVTLLSNGDYLLSFLFMSTSLKVNVLNLDFSSTTLKHQILLENTSTQMINDIYFKSSTPAVTCDYTN